MSVTPLIEPGLFEKLATPSNLRLERQIVPKMSSEATGLQCSRRPFRHLFPWLLAPRSGFRRLPQPVIDHRTIETNVSQIPVAETAQNGQLRLTLSLGDHGGHHTIDEAGKPEDEKSHRSPKCDRSRGIN